MLLPVMRLAGFFIHKSFKGTMTKKTITICGEEVEIFYCAATENGFERMSGKEISVFIPTFKIDENDNLVVEKMPTATNEDYMTLAIAGIVAADTYYDRESKITSKEIIFEATPTECKELLTTIIELRNEWYSVPKAVENTIKKESEEQKPEDPKND